MSSGCHLQLPPPGKNERNEREGEREGEEMEGERGDGLSE